LTKSQPCIECQNPQKKLDEALYYATSNGPSSIKGQSDPFRNKFKITAESYDDDGSVDLETDLDRDNDMVDSLKGIFTEKQLRLMEYAFEANFSIVKAWKGDTAGNLIYRGTARNFNPLMAMAGRITIAEVEELVAEGELDPNEIHTAGIFVNRIFKGEKYEKRIEQRTTRK
jgi:hypothetical protein